MHSYLVESFLPGLMLNPTVQTFRHGLLPIGNAQYPMHSAL